MNKISTIILARNYEDLIKDCFDSVSWADEIVLLDTGSTDKTPKIAKSFGVKVIKAPPGDFSHWRNFVTEKAAGDWLLYVDADERVTPDLKKEILVAVKDPGFEAYAIPRRNILLGRKMNYGGWWPDYVLRLIKKEALVAWEGELHEQPRIRGAVGKLKNPLVHITHRSLEEMVDKTNRWSEIEAELLFKSGHPKMTWWRFLSVMAREFWYRGIKKAGFLDGTVGWIEIIYQMYSRFITYGKLWEMQKR